jgi:hypothetical protein
MTETLDYADHDEDDLKRKSSRLSPEEGHAYAFSAGRRQGIETVAFQRAESPRQG